MEDSLQKDMEASASPQMQTRNNPVEATATSQMHNPLQTQNVRLRAMEPRDLDLLYRWENDPEVWKVSNTMVPFSKYTLQEFIKTSTMDIYASRQLRLMVEDNRGHTIGTIDIFDFEPFHRRAGLGILIDKEYRHNGYAEETVRCVCQYLFTVFQLHQVYCNVMADNEISMKLFQNAGFQLTGKQRDWIRCQGSFMDVYIWQLINEHEK